MSFSYSNLTHVSQVEETAEQVIAYAYSQNNLEIRAPISIPLVAQCLGLDIQTWDLGHLGKGVRGVLASPKGPILVDQNCDSQLSDFVVAHEMAHYCFKDFNAFENRIIVDTDDSLGLEKTAQREPNKNNWGWRDVRASYFADAVRMPITLFERHASEYEIIDSTAVDQLAKLFNVPILAVLFRLKQLRPWDRYQFLPSLRVDWSSIEDNAKFSTVLRSTLSKCQIKLRRVKKIDLKSTIDELIYARPTKLILGGWKNPIHEDIYPITQLKQREPQVYTVLITGNASEAYIALNFKCIDEVILVESDNENEFNLDTFPWTTFYENVFIAPRQGSKDVQTDRNHQWVFDGKQVVPANEEYGTKYTSQIALPIELRYPDVADAKKIIQDAKNRNLRTVLIIGCFDLLHLGHMHFLNEAKKAGDLLIVGLEDDDRIRAFKPENDIPRPRRLLLERLAMMRSLRQVDYVFVVSGPVSVQPSSADRFYSKLYKTLAPDIVALTRSDDPLTLKRQKQISKAKVEPRFVCDYVDGYSTSAQIIDIIRAWESNSKPEPALTSRSYKRLLSSSKRRASSEHIDTSEQLQLPFNISLNDP